MNTEDKKINPIIKFRKQNNYTQKNIADMLNVSQSAVSLWEKGETFPDIMNANKLALIFGVTIEDLIDSSNYYSLAPISKIRANCAKLNEEGQLKVLQYSEDLLEINRLKKEPLELSTDE